MSASRQAEVSSPQALLFDLGGVVIDLDFDLVMQRWAELSGASVGDLRSRFTMDVAYEQHERGEIDAVAYFDSLRTSLEVDLTHDELLDGWNSVYVGVVPGIVGLLAELAERFPLYGFTNSNPSHVDCWSERYRDELAVFDTVFISSSLGVRKPERESFDRIAELTGIPVAGFHFFDDLLENVEGARAAGMPATLVTSFDQMAAAARSL